MLALIDRNQPDPDDVAHYLKDTTVSRPVGQFVIKIPDCKTNWTKKWFSRPKYQWTFSPTTDLFYLQKVYTKHFVLYSLENEIKENKTTE